MTSQLTIFDDPPEAQNLTPEPAPRIPLPHQVRVPVGVGARPATADRLHKAVTKIFEATRDRNAFEQFCRVVWATLRRFEGGDPEYMELISEWSTEAVHAAKEGMQILIEHFWHDGELYDLLGDTYMRIRSDWAGKALGQYFTPWPMCRMMARQTMGDISTDRMIDGPPVSVCDPACGSGAMLLAAKAAVVELYGSHFDDPRTPANRLRLSGQDIDHVCYLMAQIQMRMSHAPWMTSFMMTTLYEGMKT